MQVDEREVITQGPVVVFRWKNAPGWPVEYVSPNAAEVFGYSAEAFLTGEVAYASLIHPDNSQRVGEEVAAATASGLRSFIHEPYAVVHRDGTTRWLYDATQIERDADGAATHYVGYVIDVTDRIAAENEARQLERRLLHSQKLESLGVLAGGVAHDFNNLLTGIMGHASLALADVAASSVARRHLAQIESLVEQAAGLTRQLLAYSGKGRFVVESTDLSLLLDEMRGMLEVVISKKAALSFRRPEKVSPVMADRAQLRQIVMNLVTNASDALGGRTGTISIEVSSRLIDPREAERFLPHWVIEPGHYVSLVVADDGCGMDEATAAKLFDPFFTTKVEGHGLGMSAVQGIVRGHKGGLRLQSALGSGTSFEVVLPVTDTTPPVVEACPSAGGWRGAGTVLVVDDLPFVRDVVAGGLEQMGFRVLLAEDGQAGLSRYNAADDEIVAVILDLSMPVMDGTEMLAALRERNPKLPVVLTSGYDETAPDPSPRTSEATCFLQKPYHLDELRKALGQLLDLESSPTG